MGWSEPTAAAFGTGKGAWKKERTTRDREDPTTVRTWCDTKQEAVRSLQQQQQQQQSGFVDRFLETVTTFTFPSCKSMQGRNLTARASPSPPLVIVECDILLLCYLPVPVAVVCPCSRSTSLEMRAWVSTNTLSFFMQTFSSPSTTAIAPHVARAPLGQAHTNCLQNKLTGVPSPTVMPHPTARDVSVLAGMIAIALGTLAQGFTVPPAVASRMILRQHPHHDGRLGSYGVDSPLVLSTSSSPFLPAMAQGMGGGSDLPAAATSMSCMPGGIGELSAPRVSRTRYGFDSQNAPAGCDCCPCCPCSVLEARKHPHTRHPRTNHRFPLHGLFPRLCTIYGCRSCCAGTARGLNTRNYSNPAQKFR